ERHEHARRAEPALQGVAFLKRLLQRMHPGFGCQPLDGLDRGAISLHGEHQAGPDSHTVENNRAGAADAMLAAKMRARKTKVLAEEVAQMHARLSLARIALLIHGQFDAALSTHLGPPAARWCAISSARRTITAPILRR